MSFGKRAALFEIGVLQEALKKEKAKLQPVKKGNINAFISADSVNLSAKRKIQNYEARIAKLKKENGL